MAYFKNKLLINNYIRLLLLFSLSCIIKWYYLAYRNYYITFSDTLIPAYFSARQYTIIEILKRLFIDFNYFFMPDSNRPFVTVFLYVISFKLGGLHPHTPFLLGIFFSSLLIPLYYLIIKKLLGTEVALSSSLSLAFLTNYIQQGLALTGQLTGIIFLALSLLFAVNYYKSRQLWRLYLSGFFLTLSSLCRYEYALFVPFFILYNFVFDKRTRVYLRIVYWAICLLGITYICLGNFNFNGSPFAIIHIQNTNARIVEHIPKLGFLKAILWCWDMLSMSGGQLILMMGLGGVCFAIKKNKTSSSILISPFFLYLGYLFYKLASGTMYSDINYFLIFLLFIIPMAFWFLRSVSLVIIRNSIYPNISLAIMTGLLIYQFHNANLIIQDHRLWYPERLIRLTEDLRTIPSNYPLYIVVDDRFLSASQDQDMLFYLKRDPIDYLFLLEGEIKIKEKSFYLLIAEDRISQVVGNKKILRDYNHLGYTGLSLYKITSPEDNGST